MISLSKELNQKLNFYGIVLYGVKHKKIVEKIINLAINNYSSDLYYFILYIAETKHTNIFLNLIAQFKSFDKYNSIFHQILGNRNFGKVKIMIYEIEKHCTVSFSNHIIEVSIIHGHLEIAKHMILEGFSVIDLDSICELAAIYGHLEIINFVIDHNFIPHINEIKKIARNGKYLDIIMALENKYD
jgi:hypothetical protein